MSRPELYLSIDIETDGPCPGLNSMLALGVAAYRSTHDGAVDDIFYRKLEPIQGAMQDGATMEWWRAPERRDAWIEVQKDQREPLSVMNEFGKWVDKLSDGWKIVAVAWPAAFDFGFVNWYMHQYYGLNNLGFACLDIRSYANGMFGVPGYYEQPSEGDLYKYLQVETADLRGHVAIDDAIRQGRLFMALRKFIIEKRKQGNTYA